MLRVLMTFWNSSSECFPKFHKYSRLWMHCFFPSCHVIRCHCCAFTMWSTGRFSWSRWFFQRISTQPFFNRCRFKGGVEVHMEAFMTSVMSGALVAGSDECIPPRCHSFRFCTLMRSDLSFNVFRVSPRFTLSTLPFPGSRVV